MENKMFCYQCEQTAGCTGCTQSGVCGKSADTARLQDELTGALIGLARATESNPATQNTYQTIIEGLFTTITNVSFDDDAIIRQIEKTHAAKEELVPGCGSCGAPCGKTEDYDMQQLWNDNEDIRSLKSLILFGLRGMAAYAYHAQMLGYQDDEGNFVKVELPGSIKPELYRVNDAQTNAGQRLVSDSFEVKIPTELPSITIGNQKRGGK